MNKKCSKCGTVFQCMQNEIEKCHCESVSLSKEQIKYLGENYNDCLCHKCLADLVKDYKLNN